MKISKLLCGAAILSISMNVLTSCTSDEPINGSNENSEQCVAQEGKLLPEFATILSKAVYDRKDVRELLKEEALKRFDCNYDVLYQLVKDRDLNGSSLRDIFVSYSIESYRPIWQTNLPYRSV